MSMGTTPSLTKEQFQEIIDDINNRLGDVEAYTKIIVGTLNAVTKERDELRADLAEARSESSRFESLHTRSDEAFQTARTDLATATERLRVAETRLQEWVDMAEEARFPKKNSNASNTAFVDTRELLGCKGDTQVFLSRLREGGEGRWDNLTDPHVVEGLLDDVSTGSATNVLESLRWDVDSLIVNHEGERVWLGPWYGPDGKRNGITDCCFESFPCCHHRRIAAESALSDGGGKPLASGDDRG